MGGTSTPALSVTIPEFIILGLARAEDVGGGQTTLKFKMKGGEYPSVTDGVVLINSEKVVACFESGEVPEALCQDQKE